MVKHFEKSIKRYVLATFFSPTCYLKSLGWGKYVITDDIVAATKFTNKSTAEEMHDLYEYDCGEFELVAVPIQITYDLIEE